MVESAGAAAVVAQGPATAGAGLSPGPGGHFADWLLLMQTWLARRSTIVEGIDRVLNAQKKPLEQQQDRVLLARQIKDCFYRLPGLPQELAGLRDGLEQAHWASGFMPRQSPGNDIVDPAEQALRAFHFWRQTRWPGGRGRLRFAHTLFNLYLVRCLTLLSMRVWDADAAGASARLSQVQSLLDQLWASSPDDQSVLVRDVRWLLHVAISPTTDALHGYFGVMANIEAGFTVADQVATHLAGVQTGAGHLRSQLRHMCVQRGVTLDDPDIVRITRKSNALDVALLTQGLVTLLEAYARARDAAPEQRQLLACAICQGISPDPELFINRLDLLAPYSMIEEVMVATDAAGHAALTPAGARHLHLLQRYRSLLPALLPQLHQDWQALIRPAEGYSPFGALFGFSSNLLELQAFRTVLPDAAAPYGMEDVFVAGAADKCAWVSNWRRLPHIPAEVVRQYEYPQAFVTEVAARVERALQSALAGAPAACGRLVLQAVEPALQPSLPPGFIVSSDPQLVAAGQAVAQDESDLLHCRLEGEFLASYPTAGGWVGISKDLLTDLLGAGQSATLTGLPAEVAALLELMCCGLAVRRD